mmetsp:Transcript_39976/g.95004  ORF Transcript_39976/g.95004 Transcript_39976/m.95004 type:complete len:231 (+) Transcript_39976:425-1117(+)
MSRRPTRTPSCSTLPPPSSRRTTGRCSPFRRAFSKGRLPRAPMRGSAQRERRRWRPPVQAGARTTSSTSATQGRPPRLRTTGLRWRTRMGSRGARTTRRAVGRWRTWTSPRTSLPRTPLAQARLSLSPRHRVSRPSSAGSRSAALPASKWPRARSTLRCACSTGSSGSSSLAPSRPCFWRRTRPPLGASRASQGCPRSRPPWTGTGTPTRARSSPWRPSSSTACRSSRNL